MSTRALWSLVAAIGLLCFVALAAAQDTASEPWLHVQISSDGHDDHGDGDDGGRDGRHLYGDDGRGDGRHDDDGRRAGDDDGDDGADFDADIHLPLSAVDPLLALVPHGTDRLLDLAGDEVNIGAMRELWRAVAGVGEAEFVAVDGQDETVRIARMGDWINVQVEQCDEDGGETVDIRIPVAVVDALLSGDGETLNVHAAAEQLGELRGDIVRASGGEHQVRVWIDDIAQPGN